LGRVRVWLVIGLACEDLLILCNAAFVCGVNVDEWDWRRAGKWSGWDSLGVLETGKDPSVVRQVRPKCFFEDLGVDHPG
jgi:hypothetical protein